MSIRLKKQKLQKGAPVPLFDRLIDTEPHIKSEPKVKNVLSEAALKKSIAQELANILDSRIGSHIDLPERSKSDYAYMPEQFGIRDFAGLTAQDESGQRKIASHVKAAILRYEPRLLNPRVRVTKAKAEEFDVDIAIAGDVMIDNIRKRVQFPMVLTNILGSK